MSHRAAAAVFALIGLWGARPSRAFAWDASAAGVAQRTQALERSRKAAKTPADALADVLARARQKRPPDWTKKSVWKEDYAGRSYAFGVGAVQGVRNRALRVSAAEDRARAAIASLSSTTTVSETKDAAGNVTGRDVETSSAAALKNTTPVDWYWSAADRTFYALIVQMP
jgi:hypothetical protein